MEKPPRLLDQIRHVARLRRYSFSTELVAPCKARSTGPESDWLKKIPQVAVEIFKYGNGTVFFLLCISDEYDSCLTHCIVVSLEIVCLEKEEYAPACLIADESFLLWRRSPGQ